MKTEKTGFDKLAETLENIRLEREDGIGVITMNRPGAMNALNRQTIGELSRIVDYISGSDEIKGVIITGEGRAFVAGADITEICGCGAGEGRDYSNFAQSVFNRIEAMEKPVIAAVNGYALGGGCELAMCCDIRIASETAVFGQPEVNLGVIPCFGGTQRLTRLVGSGIAKELIFTGRNVKPEEAKALGLVNKVVPADRLLAEAKEMMGVILGKAPKAIQYAKVAINKGADMELSHGLELEKDLCALAFATEDSREGMTAFKEKRAAHFQNK